MVTLRNYQLSMLNLIKNAFALGRKRVIMQLPTGAGKTALFSSISKMAIDKGSSVLVITDRAELLQQSGNTLERFGLTVSILSAKTKQLTKGNLYVGMVETIKRRILKPDYEKFVQSFNMIIIDECHVQSFNRIFESLTVFQYVIGATATPIRSGKMRELKQDYDEIITGVQIPELIETGFLSPVETFGVKIDLTGVRTLAGDYAADDLEKIYAKKYVGAVENYLKHTPGKKALCFCATVKNSIDLSAEFERAGVSSKHIDATTPENERAQILTDFDAGKFKVLSNVGILTKGYDCPTIETIILYRATQSLPLFLQMCGRGSRVSPGKGKFTILDFGNNVLRHGFWEEKRYWSLENEVKKERGKKDIATVKICPQCEAMIYVSVKICGFCGYDFTDKQKEEKEKQFAVLSQMTPSQVNAYTHFATVEELEQLRIAKGYKAGWILHKLETLKQYEDYGKLKGYKRGWAYWQWKNRSENTK